MRSSSYICILYIQSSYLEHGIIFLFFCTRRRCLYLDLDFVLAGACVVMYVCTYHSSINVYKARFTFARALSRVVPTDLTAPFTLKLVN
ncbi:uncharacterized protein J3D65DRAFT_170681 [Phyllosticta citribraziliensis]|uniref:Uncharacterized protein n=1 Tax=Phyllosticta citribraziliensis TaxID=989973 RepID=A0ABR1L4K3_9PEZI